MSCTNITNGIVCNFTINEAEFTFEGETVHMEFHRWCGPIFTKKVYDKEWDLYEDEEIYADGSPRFDSLWEQFYKWDEETQTSEKNRQDWESLKWNQ